MQRVLEFHNTVAEKGTAQLHLLFENQLQNALVSFNLLSTYPHIARHAAKALLR